MMSPTRPGTHVKTIGAVLTWVCCLPLVSGAHAADDAMQTLKAMSDYLAGQKAISASFDADIEVITTDLEKIQYTNSGSVTLVRPDKVRAARVGGYTDVELIFDGKTATLLGRHNGTYAQVEAPGSTDQLFDRLRNEHGVQAPAADLLLSDVYAALSKDVVTSKYLGAGVVGNNECHHLAFRNEETDWQLWVQTGDKPIPCKLVITSKSVAAAPQFTLVIREWATNSPADPETFTFKAPQEAKKVKIEDLADYDEVPASVVKGGDK